MKYKLTNNKKEFGGRTLYQIEALKDFGNVRKGDLGGWIEREDNLSQDDNCWVLDNAEVFGNAEVSGSAQVYENARVSGDAEVFGSAEVHGDAQVYGNAEVHGNAWVFENAWVSGNARVSGNAKLSANLHYKKGWFIGGDDTGEITNITDKTGTDYWKAQYVLGDYVIEEQEDNVALEAIKLLEEKGYRIIKDN